MKKNDDFQFRWGLDKTILAVILGGSFIYLNFFTDWVTFFAQASVLMWGVFAV